MLGLNVKLGFTKLFLSIVVALSPLTAMAQFVPPVASPQAQRNCLGMVRTKISIFLNVTRTAPNFGQQAYGNLLGEYQELRTAYDNLKQTLAPAQWQRGANSLAELDAGLDIISEAFTNFQNDLAVGRSSGSATRDLCQVLRQGVQLWSQELNKTASGLRIGLG